MLSAVQPKSPPLWGQRLSVRRFSL